MLVKAKVDNEFKAKVAKCSVGNLLGYNSIDLDCMGNNSKCTKDQFKVTYKSNDIELLCFKIFNPNSPLHKLAKWWYHISLPLTKIINEILPKQ